MKRVLSLLSTVMTLSIAGFATLFAACDSGGTEGPPDVTMVSMANATKYVANSLTVPLDRMQFGMDLNGDGKTDNQLGNIIGALSANNLNTQEGVDSAVCKGTLQLPITTTSGDATFQNDSATGALVQLGKAFEYMGPDTCTAGSGGPKYDGTDEVVLDSSFSGAQFAGRISNGLFSSNSPVTTKNPVTIKLQLPLVSGAAPVSLNVVGAHIQFRVSGGKITGGQINGAITAKDVQDNIIPNVATLLNDRVKDNPTGSTEKQILQIFDIGCTSGTGVKGDGMIATCEVADNSIIKNVLNPDVQMFDGTTYKPNKDNTTKDSLSLGLGFTAVKASF